jgi:group I intron endonuclease
MVRRERDHFRSLRNGKHENIVLQRVFDKYGEDQLVFEVIFTCPERLVLILEQYLLDEYFGSEECLNINPNAACPPAAKSEGWKAKMTGRVLSAETRAKMSLAKRGIPKSEEHKKKISEAKMGISHSEFHKKKIKEGMEKSLKMSQYRARGLRIQE